MEKFLEAGRVVNTHGVRGAVRIEPWCDSPEFLLGFKKLFIGGERYDLLAASVHKSQVLCTLGGVTTMDDALRLKGKVVRVDRAEAKLEPGRYFIADLIGAEVVDRNRGVLGKIAEVMTLPANNVYVVRGERGEFLIPAVGEFVKRTDVENRVVEVELIDGMESEK